MSFKFDFLNIKSFTKFLLYYIIYCIILYFRHTTFIFALSIWFFIKLSLFLCFYIDCLHPSCLLMFPTQKACTNHPFPSNIKLFYQLFFNGFLTGILGVSRLSIQWLQTLLVGGPHDMYQHWKGWQTLILWQLSETMLHKKHKSCNY